MLSYVGDPFIPADLNYAVTAIDSFLVAVETNGYKN